jgi:hypothetical protein
VSPLAASGTKRVRLATPDPSTTSLPRMFGLSMSATLPGHVGTLLAPALRPKTK